MTPAEPPACPFCHAPAALVIGDQQAMCGNDECRVVMWDPTMTVDELLENLHLIDLPPWLQSS